MTPKQNNVYFFDCDGVILNSNRIKSQAFKEVAKQFGSNSNAEKLYHYHIENGGISRFAKFDYFFKNILGQSDVSQKEMSKALSLFEDFVLNKLLVCDLVPGFLDIISSLEGTKYVVSGGKETELKHIFEKRHLSKYFEGVYGSPRTKYEIIEPIVSKHPDSKFIFFGDSKLDWEVAKYFKMKFIFISGFSEWKEGVSVLSQIQPSVQTIPDFSSLKEILQDLSEIG